MSKPTVSWLTYPSFFDFEGRPATIATHVVPARFEESVASYIEETYGQRPGEVYRGHVIWLDPGGVVMVDSPLAKVRLTGCSAKVKYEHIPDVLGLFERRLESGRRRRVYDGVETVTVHGLAHSVVLSVRDAEKLVRALRASLPRAHAALVELSARLDGIPNIVKPRFGPAPAEA